MSLCALKTLIAQMAKLVDALVSGTSVSNDVQVRVLFWAQSGAEVQRHSGARVYRSGAMAQRRSGAKVTIKAKFFL